MSNLTTDIQTIYSKKPCPNRFALLLNKKFNLNINFRLNIAKQFNLLTSEQQKSKVTLLEILNTNGVRDAVWSLKYWDYKDYCLLLANIAESVFPIFESKFPDKKEIKLLIKGIKDYHANKISLDELKVLNHTSSLLYSDIISNYADIKDRRNKMAPCYAAATAIFAGYAADNNYSDANIFTAVADYADYAASANDANLTQWQTNENLIREFCKI